MHKPQPSEDAFILVLLRGRVMGRVWPCENTMVIGRDPRADITITDDSVSRRHASIECDPYGKWWVVDHHSRNGVFLNGKRVDHALLSPGDRIHIGESCIFKFSRTDALERQLVESQKLEAVGRLASGIAHDYNNILMVISANTDYLEESFQPGVSTNIDDLIESVAMIKSASDRAAGITRQLLEFAQQRTERRGRVALGKVAFGAIEMAQRAMSPNVFIETEIDERVVAHGAEGRIAQVILNLCLNAGDAMPDGGRVRVTVASQMLNTSLGGASDAVPAGDWAVLTVSDTGTGITEADRARIFEPFFTTKAVGEGTGLGLAMVYGIVTQHGGFITVASEPGAGAKFTVFLPRLPFREALVAPEQPAPAPFENGRILLVDDDDAVRRATERLLTSVGFEVIVANGGKQAIEMFLPDPRAFQFVLLDLVMPVMSGLDTYRHLRGISPSAIIVICSGGGSNQASRALEEGANGFLSKPFSVDQLTEAFIAARSGQSSS